MAAVIRYLSADNHTADTPPFNCPETGRRGPIISLFHGPVFETGVSVSFTFLNIQYDVCVCAGVCVRVYRYYR